MLAWLIVAALPVLAVLVAVASSGRYQRWERRVFGARLDAAGVVLGRVGRSVARVAGRVVDAVPGLRPACAAAGRFIDRHQFFFDTVELLSIVAFVVVLAVELLG